MFNDSLAEERFVTLSVYIFRLSAVVVLHLQAQHRPLAPGLFAAKLSGFDLPPPAG
jgi:hypothetical protein